MAGTEPMTDRPELAPVVFAGGGLLWWRSPEGLRLALIHRRRYDDWALPKGKREAGERLIDTACREVREETGCSVEVTGFAGATGYLAKGAPKVVLFWNMERRECAFAPSREVDRMEWVTGRNALSRLNYVQEQELVARVLYGWQPSPSLWDSLAEPSD